MKKLMSTIAVGAMVSAFAGTASAEISERDLEMITLAGQAGCGACHSIVGGVGPDGGKPVGPNWMDVAKKYAGDKTALKELTTIVMHGSSPYASHWKGEVSGYAMPPNAVAITEDNAEKLVAWILDLAK